MIDTQGGFVVRVFKGAGRAPIALFRLVAILSLAALCASCAVDMVDAVSKSRAAMVKQLREPDPQGQEAMRRSWYGRLLDVLYSHTPEDAVLKDRVDDSQVAELQQLLQAVADSLIRSGREREIDEPLRAALELPTTGRKLTIVVLRDDAHQILIDASCTKSAVTFSAEAVRQIVKTALSQKEVNELQGLAEQFFFSSFQINASPDETELTGSSVAVLFGPTRSRYVTKKLEQQLGAQGTVVWKALAFIIGHEAHHLWAGQCGRNADNALQQHIEARADVLGTILAITTYNRRCGRTLVASRQDALLMLDPDAQTPVFPPEVTWQMQLVPSPQLLVGASGIATMQRSLGPYFDADPSHPELNARLAIDERGTEALSSKLFDQPISASLAASLIGKLAGIPKEELVASIYRDLEFNSNYHLVDSYLLCTDIDFKSKPDNPYGGS